MGISHIQLGIICFIPPADFQNPYYYSSNQAVGSLAGERDLGMISQESTLIAYPGIAINV